ncbi:MAG: hypothetical protein LQ347_003535 [Umbilicaria vellea]|nr:MAG: hypothetical protein LQ347_003535 [Umbilicaria vellea]
MLESFPLGSSDTESRFLELLESFEDSRKEAAVTEANVAERMAEQLAADERCTEVTTRKIQAIRSAVLRMRNTSFVAASRPARERAQSLS